MMLAIERTLIASRRGHAAVCANRLSFVLARSWGLSFSKQCDKSYYGTGRGDDVVPYLGSSEDTVQTPVDYCC